MTEAPPSTRISDNAVPLAAVTADTTSAVWYAIASTTARAKCARVVPRVNPTMVPRAYGSHHGEPKPVNAGTRNTPPVSGTDDASGPVSAADAMIPKPSRNHCTAAPVTKIAPSIAYVTAPGASDHATVVRSPSTGAGSTEPTFVSTNEPVPYVFFVMPGSTHACPNSAACWSPAMPLTGTRNPAAELGAVTPNRPDD